MERCGTGRTVRLGKHGVQQVSTIRRLHHPLPLEGRVRGGGGSHLNEWSQSKPGSTPFGKPPPLTPPLKGEGDDLKLGAPTPAPAETPRTVLAPARSPPSPPRSRPPATS